MGIHDLQHFLEGAALEGGSVSVDLLKIARSVTHRQPHNSNRKVRPIGNKLKLIVDAENCLDRLYGGYFSDWACGGQWNRMIQFLSLLTHAIERGNIELAVVFNGTIDNARMNEWIVEQANNRQKVGMVLKHINTKATPPPKVWWMAPTSLRSALRMSLRHLGVTVMCTMDDHHQEVIGYCREYGFHGLLADDPEYLPFDPPRYFSSEHLKLTYKGSLETKEYMVHELLKRLNLTQEQLCIVAALLGNFLLPESSLQDFHKRLGLTSVNKDNKSPSEYNVRTLADLVRTLPPISNMDGIITAVLGSVDEKRAPKLKESIQYYLNGTASGFLKYSNTPANTIENRKPASETNESNNKAVEEDSLEVIRDVGFASETSEQEEETLQNYKLATANLIMSSDYCLDANAVLDNHADPQENGFSNGSSPTTTPPTPVAPASAPSSGTATKLLTNSNNSTITTSTSSSSTANSSVPSSPKQIQTQSPQQTSRPNVVTSGANVVTPSVSPDVLRTASLRHQKGLMTSTILHVLSTREARLPCLMEDESNREFPPIHDVYQPLRQRVYAVLFNLHHLRYVHAKKKESGEIGEEVTQPDVVVKEWVYSRANPYQYPKEVKADPLPWAVPTLQRLWFGPGLDDKRRRMRALLSCLNSDTPLILNTGYVPQHMLIMACVLRYIMSQEKAIMRRHELDAFLCQAFNGDLMNPQYLQELTLNVVTSRGVQLAALFMQGVEMALLANDACGAPLPWLMCCPWLYFDGKLFHHTLNRSAHSKNILEVCENHIERVVKVERMRKAVLEGLDVKFAKKPMAPFPGMVRQGMPAPPPSMAQHLPPQSMGMNANRMTSGNGTGSNIRPQRPMQSRGGQLQVAGVVVGSWGANYGYQQQQQQTVGPAGMRPVPPHLSQMMGGGGNYQQNHQRPHRGGGIFNHNQYQQQHQHQNFQQSGPGGRRGGGGGQGHHQQQRGSKQGPHYYPNRRNNNAGNKKRNHTNRANRNQGNQAVLNDDIEETHVLTVHTDRGDIPVDELDDLDFQSPATTEIKEDQQRSGEHHQGQGDGPNLVEPATM